MVGDILLIFLLVNVSKKPVPSPMVIPIKEIKSIPNGPKLRKFLEALLIINFNPSNDNKFSTVINVGSSSFVFILIVLYVAWVWKRLNIQNTKEPIQFKIKKVKQPV